jgi:hypothetical protein
MSDESCPDHGTNYEPNCTPCWLAYQAFQNRIDREAQTEARARTVRAATGTSQS